MNLNCIGNGYMYISVLRLGEEDGKYYNKDDDDTKNL